MAAEETVEATEGTDLDATTAIKFRGGRLQKCKVLFCTQHFPWGMAFTREALPDDCIEVAHCDSADVAANIGDAHVAVPFMATLDEAVLERAPHLRLIIQYGVGVEGVDMTAATSLGISVSNIPSATTGNAVSCAEHIIFLALSLLRDTKGMASSIKDRLIGQPLGRTLFGKKVVIVGSGDIAQALLPRLGALGTHVTVVRTRDVHRNTSTNLPQPRPHDADTTASQPSLQQQLPHADIVVLACTETAATRGLVGADFLKACADGVHIINVARGGLLDFDAVRIGLAAGKIGGLGLDVAWQEPLDPAEPVWNDPRVIATPHVAGVTELSYRNMAHVLAGEVRRVQQGLPPSKRLN